MGVTHPNPNLGRRFVVLVIGLDLGRKSRHQAVVLDDMQREVFARQVTSSAEDLERLLRAVRRHERDGEIHVIMEATGMAWLVPVEFFKTAGCRVYRVRADNAADFRRYLSKHTKTDEVDAASLARMRFIEPNALEEVHLRDRERFTLKQLIKQREDFLADAVRYKNRLRDLLDAYIPGLSALSNRLVQKRKFRPVLEKLLDLSWVQTMGRKRFHRYVRRRDASLKEGEVDRIYASCTDALKLHDEAYIDFNVLQNQAANYTETVAFAEAKVDELTRQIEATYRVTDADQILKSIPGMGELAAAYAEAYLAPIERFPDEKSVDSWVGVIPLTSASGQVQRKGLRMSKTGSTALRRVLYLVADVARQHDPQIAALYYREMVDKGNPHTKAVVACMRRVLHRIVRLMRDHRPYELRDLEGTPVDRHTARRIISDELRVPPSVRRRLKQRREAS